MRIGIDLGGTKIEGIALSPEGEILVRQRVSTPSGYAESLEAITSMVLALDHATGGRGSVGVGIPGTIVPATGLVKNANTIWLNQQPLGRDLESQLQRPVRVMNDANCFALSEASDGAGANADVVFGVILGTGVGGGIVVGGRCLIGATLITGEWGHHPLPWPEPDERLGTACYCGKYGCIETWGSGPGLERDHARHTGQMLSTRDIVSFAAAGDPDASTTMARYHDRLARSLASIINVLDPDVIVLGGGMSNIEGLAERIAGRLARYVFSDSVVTRVVRNAHGDSSGVRGAAWAWPIEGA